MAWPDISRKLWSYIITKLGLFTNVDPSKLEVSSTSLKLNEVAVDHSKLALPGLSITQCVIQKLSLELNSSGLSINALNLQASAVMSSLEPPDLALSTIMENSINSLAQLGRDEELETQGNSSGLVAKLADLALSQISLRVSEIHLDIVIPDKSVLRIFIEEVSMSSKHQFEVEAVSVSRVSHAGEHCLHDDASSSSVDEPAPMDMMAQSIYLDAASSWRDMDARRNENFERDQLLAYLDHLTLRYYLDPAEVRITAEQVRLDGFESLDAFVTLFNGTISHSASSHNTDEVDTSQRATVTFFLSRLELYESFEHVALPVLIEDVELRPSELKVGSLRIPGVLELTPFLTVRIGDRLIIDMTTPLSASLPLELLPTAQRVVVKLIDLLRCLATPEDAQPALFTLNIPEMRVSIGPVLVINVFPQSGTEEFIEFREITLTLADNQLMMSNIKIDVRGGVSIEAIKLRLTSMVSEDLALIWTSLDPMASSNHERTALGRRQEPPLESAERAGSQLPNIKIDVARLDVEEYETSARISGQLKARLSESECVFEVNCHLQLLEYVAGFELTGRSDDGLKTVKADMRCKDVKIPLRRPTSSKNIDGVEESPRGDSSVFQAFPDTVINIINEDEIELGTADARLAVRVDHIKLKIIGGVAAVRIPRLYIDAIDSHEGSRIPVLKLKNTTVLYLNTLKVDMEGLFLSTCADSHEYIVGLLSRLTPEVQLPKFHTEADRDVDVLNLLTENEFTEVSSLPASVKSKAPMAGGGSLKIEENYMSYNVHHPKQSPGSCSPPSKVLSERGTESFTSMFTIKRLKWELHDGFDFHRTRSKFKEAIKKITSAAKDIEESQDADDESSIVGDFMYNSILITVPASKADELGSDIAKQFGSTSGLERSADPKLALTLRNLRIASTSQKPTANADASASTSITVREGNVADLLESSRFNYMISPAEDNKRNNIFTLMTETVGARDAPETRSNLQIRPLRVSLDQDTLEFIVRYFQFTDEEEPQDGESSEQPSSTDLEGTKTFLQRFEFGELPLILDYTPKKLDYKSLRSGIAAELLNVFAVKGAKIVLQSSIQYGTSGWDEVYSTLLQEWLPDVRNNQLLGLISGIGPVRRAVKVSKGVTKYTIVPLRRQQISRGTSVVVKRTIDELLRIDASRVHMRTRSRKFALANALCGLNAPNLTPKDAAYI